MTLLVTVVVKVTGCLCLQSDSLVVREYDVYLPSLMTFRELGSDVLIISRGDPAMHRLVSAIGRVLVYVVSSMPLG